MKGEQLSPPSQMNGSGSDKVKTARELRYDSVAFLGDYLANIPKAYNELAALLPERTTNAQLINLLNVARQAGANPRLGEVYLMGGRPTFNRNFYRIRAKEEPTFLHQHSLFVCENDEFSMSYCQTLGSMKIETHRLSQNGRGRVVLGYSILSTKGRPPVVTIAPIQEHYKGQFELDPETGVRGTSKVGKPTTWDKQPGLMIAKIAQVNAIRERYPDVFRGYADIEIDPNVSLGEEDGESPSRIRETEAEEYPASIADQELATEPELAHAPASRESEEASADVSSEESSGLVDGKYKVGSNPPLSILSLAEKELESVLPPGAKVVLKGLKPVVVQA